MTERDCENYKHHISRDCENCWESAEPTMPMFIESENAYMKWTGDLISRADAIETVLTYFIPRSHTGERGEHEEDFVRTIFKALPSADEQIQSIVEKRVAELVHLNYELEQQLADRPRGEWIPCSERLPNVGEDVLFCDSEWTEKGWLMANGDWWRLCWSMVIPKEEVTAWMPLPMPYREDGEA